MRFQEQFWFLSNFYPAPVHHEGDVYPTVEHAYQAAKTVNEEERTRIREAETPAIAKRLGRFVTLVPYWEAIKVDVMRTLLRQKFSYPEMRANLLNTGYEELVEENTWGDTFWGVCNGVGQNQLGILLMEIRRELRGGK